MLAWLYTSSVPKKRALHLLREKRDKGRDVTHVGDGIGKQVPTTSHEAQRDTLTSI